MDSTRVRNEVADERVTFIQTWHIPDFVTTWVQHVQVHVLHQYSRSALYVTIEQINITHFIKLRECGKQQDIIRTFASGLEPSILAPHSTEA